MDKLLQLCNLFHCSIDDLVQKDISQVYVEENTDYNSHYNEFSKFISIGVGTILIGLSIMFLAYGMNYFFPGEPVKEDFIGIIFLIFVVIAVAIFVLFGIRDEDFKKKNPFVINFYKEKEIDAFNKKFSVMVTVGVSLYIINLILLLGLLNAFPKIDGNEYLECLVMSFFFLIITIATVILVYACMQKDKYDIDKYNQMNDKNSETYKKDKLTGSVCGCIMLLATIVYLIFGFIYDGWGMPYVLSFAVGGICCGIASIIINIKNNK